MIAWAFAFLALAALAALFGFGVGGGTASAAGIGKILFVAFLVLALVSLASGVLRRRAT